MKPTNRLTKTLSQFIASKDDLRPALNGIAFNGRHFVATNGHLFVYGKTHESEDPRFEAPGVYKIDEGQSLTSDFFPQPHERIFEQFPKAAEILPKDSEYPSHTVKLNVDTLYDLVRTLKKLRHASIMLHFPEDPHKGILFEVDPKEYNDETEIFKGILMPCLNNEADNYGKNPFSAEDIENVRQVCSESTPEEVPA